MSSAMRNQGAEAAIGYNGLKPKGIVPSLRADSVNLTLGAPHASVLECETARSTCAAAIRRIPYIVGTLGCP